MNEIDMLRLKSQGYCCSQIMVLAALDILEKENDDLVRFAGGLCMGGGMETGACGILTAGISILAMYAKKDDERLVLMQDTYLNFFKSRAQKGQSVACIDIAGDFYPASNPDTCGPILFACHSQLTTILVENGFDPTDNTYD